MLAPLSLSNFFWRGEAHGRWRRSGHCWVWGVSSLGAILNPTNRLIFMYAVKRVVVSMCTHGTTPLCSSTAYAGSERG